MINTERNRALLTDLFAALGREGWGEVFLAALRDDVVFNAMGRSPIAGHYEGKRVYSEEVLAKLHDRLFVRPTLVVDKIIVGPFGQFYAKAGERRWWREELACGHDVMLDMPNELTALLLQRS
jgi:hypothetical protein